MRSSPEHVRQIISQWFPDHSEAARYWDSLKPEWRGVVLHAASVYGHEALNASLAKCNWCELYARLDHRRMMQLRAGIREARNLFAGFGSLREKDFSPRTAHMVDRQPPRQQLVTTQKLPESTVNLISGRNQVRQQKTQGQQA